MSIEDSYTLVALKISVGKGKRFSKSYPQFGHVATARMASRVLVGNFKEYRTEYMRQVSSTCRAPTRYIAQ
jgi:hypothetical protein